MKNRRVLKKGLLLGISGMMVASGLVVYPMPPNGTTSSSRAATAYDTIDYNKVVNLDANIAYPETNAFWSAPYYSEGSTFVASATATAYAKKDVKLVREAKTARGIYYQVKIGNQLVGWLDKRAFTFYTMPTSNEVFNRPAIVQTVTGHAAWTEPYGQMGSTRIGPASDYLNKQVQLLRKVVNPNSTYYQFSLNGKTIGWMDSRAFDVYDVIESNTVVDMTGVIANGATNAIWTEPYRVIGTKLVAQATAYQDKKAVIHRIAKTTRSTYYQISVDGKLLGWMDQRAFNEIHVAYLTNQAVTLRADRSDSSAVVASVEPFAEVTGVFGSTQNGWIKVNYAGKTGYVKVADLTEKNKFTEIISEKKVNYGAGVILGNEFIYEKNVYNAPGASKKGASSEYLNQFYQVDMEKVTADSTIWAHLVYPNGEELGWIKKASLKTISAATFDELIKFLTTYPDYKTYFEGIFDDTKLDNDLDTLIRETIVELSKMEKESQIEMEQLQQEYTELAVNPLNPEEDQQPDENGVQSRNIGTALAARGAYTAGMALVAKKGNIITANYMKHAQVPYGIAGWLYKPKNITHKNDSVANRAYGHRGFFFTINGKFEKEMLEKGKTNATVTGSYVFESGADSDLHTAFNKVKYTATFKKKKKWYL